MKTKNLLIIILILLSLVELNFAQEISSEIKQKVISALYSINRDSTAWAIDAVIDHNIYEAKEAVEQRIWGVEKILQDNFIEALFKFNSLKTHEYALAYLDSLRHYDIIQPQNDSIRVISILFGLNDFSKIDPYFSILDSYNNSSDIIYGLDGLSLIIRNYPTYEQRAKEKLINTAFYNEDKIVRWFAINDLDSLYGEQVLPLLLKFFKEDSAQENRSAILRERLFKYKNAEIINAIRERLLSDPSEYVRLDIAYVLRKNLGSPTDYKIVKDYYPNESDKTIKKIMEIEIGRFRPILPDSQMTKNAMVDTLQSYTQQCYSLNWLDNNLLGELLTKIQNAKTYLLNSDSLNCAKQIKSFQQKVDFEYDDTLNTTPSFVTSDAYKFLHYYAQYILDRLPSSSTDLIVTLKRSTGALLTTGSLQYYEGSWKDAINNGDGTFTVITNLNSVSLRMIYEYGSQTVSNVNAHNNTYTFQTVNVKVQLQNSQGFLIDSGSVQYYAGAWRNFGSTVNGIALKELLPGNYSFRMSYAYASKDKQQNIGDDPVVVFQTVTANVQLKNSMDEWLNGGTVQYYAGAWRNFGTITDGLLVKELLPNNYSFRMTYAYANKDKQQNIGDDPVVVFQTIAANVQLQNSLGNLIDQGTVQYYSGAWREFGTTTNGVAVKELLPNNYSFRMTYAFAGKDKQQDLSTNPIVVFQTVVANVQLQNSSGNLIDQGTVQYYSGAWREFGTTTNGVAVKELLPNNYSFRMTYEYISNDKAQDISTNNTVNFSTVLCTISVKDAQNNPVNDALASYYSGAWRQIGNTINGEIKKELLPANLTFRVKYGSIQKDKQQNIGTNNLVEFSLQP